MNFIQPKKFFFKVFCFAAVVCECFYLYTAFGCHYREIHHAILGKTIAFTVSPAVHFGVWASFLMFLGYHCIEITSSSNSFCVVLSKPRRVKLLGKSKRWCHWNLPFSETISMVSLKQSQQYSSTTPHTLALYIHD